MNQSLAGYWVHNKTGNDQLRGWSAKEQGDFFAHFERIQPTASLFHEVLEWAVEAKKRVPACNIVYRRYIDPKRGFTEGNIWRSWNAQQHLDEFLPWWRPGLILNIWNEANPDLGEMDKFSKVASDVMDAFGKEGKPIAIWHPSVGTPNEGNETIDRLTPLWEAFDRWYDLHIMGWHEYGTHRGMLFNEKGSDYNVYPYRVGRAVELIHPKVVARGHKGFRLIFTEFGSDYAFDGQGGKRGYRDYWGGKKFGQEVVAAIEKTKRPYVLGYCLYKKGNSAGWGDFDTLNDTDYDKEIEEGTRNGRLAPVPPIVVTPIPAPTPPQPLPLPPTPPDAPLSRSEIDIRKVAELYSAIEKRETHILELDAEILALQADIEMILAKWMPPNLKIAS